MIKSCLSLLAGAYALHFTSFTSIHALLPLAVFGAGIAYLAAGRGAAAGFVAGFVLFVLHALQVVAERLPPQFEGDSVLAVVQIADFPRPRHGAISFIAWPVNDPRLPPRLRVSWFDAPEAPEIGDTWQLELRLRRPRGTSNPGVFDYEAWLFRQRIGATGYVVNGARNLCLGSGASGAIDRLRQRVVKRLEAVVDDAETAAVIAAISVGARHGITAEQWLRYARTGTSHLMAISGLHIGLAAMSAWFIVLVVCALLRLGENRLRIASIAAASLALGYAGLSGFAVPAQRAALMLLAFVLILLRSRDAAPVTVLAAACWLVVVFDPLATLAPGFQLSFAAVLVLLWFARLQGPAANRSRALQLAAVQLYLLFALLPLTVVNFGRVSFVAPLVNFVAVPLFSVATVPLVLAGVALDGPLAIAGDAALRVAAASIDLLQWIVQRAASMPYAAIDTATAGSAGVLCLVLVLAWAALPRAWPGRYVALLATLAIVSQRVAGPPESCVDVRMLDVGQGLAVVVRTRHRTMLYDTAAAYRGGVSMAERVVLPYLSAQGIGKIDRLVVSHSDSDHSGGLAAVIAAVDVADILAGEPHAPTAGGADGCRRGQAWRWDGVEFRVLHPPATGRGSGNDASCVILVRAGTAALLLTGDIGAAVEQALVRAGLGRVDAVVVPHHGSATSSSPHFVAALGADVALVSSGYANRWGLPRPDVVERWQQAGTVVLETARDGAVGLRLCDRVGLVRVSRHRLARRRVWHEGPVG